MNPAIILGFHARVIQLMPRTFTAARSFPRCGLTLSSVRNTLGEHFFFAMEDQLTLWIFKRRLLLRSWWHSIARSHLVRIRQRFRHQHCNPPREVGWYVFFVCLTLVNTNNTLIWHLVILRPWLPNSMRSAGKGDSPRSCRAVQEAKPTRALFGRRMQG